VALLIHGIDLIPKALNVEINAIPPIGIFLDKVKDNE